MIQRRLTSTSSKTLVAADSTGPRIGTGAADTMSRMALELASTLSVVRLRAADMVAEGVRDKVHTYSSLLFCFTVDRIRYIYLATGLQ